MKNRIYSFQILRAVAITLIFLSHCDNLIRVNDSNCLIYLGAAGVSLFIALSGFLCAGKYSGTETVQAFAIYKKRWRQFYKNHFIMLIIAVPLSIGVLKRSPIKWGMELIANATLIQSLIPVPSVYFSFNAVSWYLSLICCFALLTPIAVKIWGHLSLKSTIVLSVLLTIIEFLIIVFGTDYSFIHWLAYVFPAIRFLDFIIGGGYWKLGKFIIENRLFNLNWLLFSISSAIMIAAMVISCYIGNNFFLTAVWTMPATVLVTSIYNIRIKEDFANKLAVKVLIFFGDISFEFFLLHQLSIRYLMILFSSLNTPDIGVYAIAFAISLIGALVMHSGVKINRKI